MKHSITLDGDARIDVAFQYDLGDSSVGIGPSWGEGTGAVIVAGPFRTHIEFDVRADAPVKTWPVLAVHTEQAEGVLAILAVQTYDDGAVVLGDMPLVAKAVKQLWKRVRLLERLQVAEEVARYSEEALDTALADEAIDHQGDEVAEARAAVERDGKRERKLRERYDRLYGDVEAQERHDRRAAAARARREKAARFHDRQELRAIGIRRGARNPGRHGR